MKKINVKEKFNLFNEYWSPKILGELNGNQVKIFKAKGEFIWHKHEEEDEFFLVIHGQLTIKFKDNEIVLNEGEFCIVPKNVDHLPFAKEEAHVLLFEPKQVLNTGTQNENTVIPEWI